MHLTGGSMTQSAHPGDGPSAAGSKCMHYERLAIWLGKLTLSRDVIVAPPRGFFGGGARKRMSKH
jgi:hypothetical protein